MRGQGAVRPRLPYRVLLAYCPHLHLDACTHSQRSRPRPGCVDDPVGPHLSRIGDDALDAVAVEPGQARLDLAARHETRVDADLALHGYVALGHREGVGSRQKDVADVAVSGVPPEPAPGFLEDPHGAEC